MDSFFILLAWEQLGQYLSLRSRGWPQFRHSLPLYFNWKRPVAGVVCCSMVKTNGGSLIGNVPGIGRANTDDTIVQFPKIPVIYQDQIIVLGKMKISGDGIGHYGAIGLF